MPAFCGVISESQLFLSPWGFPDVLIPPGTPLSSIHVELGCYRVIWPEAAPAVSRLFLPPGPTPNEREWVRVRLPRLVHGCTSNLFVFACLHTLVDEIRPGIGTALIQTP